MSTFQELGLNEDLLNAITDMGFETPSDVQEQAIPLLLNEERDLVALAQTGTGKTAAFGFPMLQKIDVDSRTTQGLILSPTRELCLQITNELKQYGKYCKGLKCYRYLWWCKYYRPSTSSKTWCTNYCGNSWSYERYD